MAKEKVTGVETNSNCNKDEVRGDGPRVTREEVTRRIRRIVARLSLLLESVFDDRDMFWRDLYLHGNIKEIPGSTETDEAIAVKSGVFGLVEWSVLCSLNEIEECYALLHPAEVSDYPYSSRVREKIDKQDGLSYSGPDLSSDLFVPMASLRGISETCTSESFWRDSLSTSAFHGFGVVLDDIRSCLVSCLDRIENYQRKEAA